MEIIGKWFESWNCNLTMWMWFIPAAFFTILGSIKMVKYAELIIQKTKLGGAFVGFVLVSIISCLPELLTEISQGVIGKPATGLSDDIGANAFSTFMLAISLLIFAKFIFSMKISNWIKTTILISLFISFSITIILATGFDYQIGEKGFIAIGIVPIILLLIYLITVVFSYKYRNQTEEIVVVVNNNLTIKTIIFKFICYSILLVFSSLFLNWIMDAIQLTYSIDEKSSGGIMLSIATALPEAIALFLFMKKGYFEAAIGSIIGAHIFNWSCIFWGDIAYNQEAIILNSFVDSVWMIALMVTIELSLLFIVIIFKKNKIIYYSISSLIVLTYIIGWILILIFSS